MSEIFEQHELINTGSSPTKNKNFDENGFLVIRDLWNPEDLFCEPPSAPGQYQYYGSVDKYTHVPSEDQVEGSTSRYYWPPYKYAHSQIRLKLEKAIGCKLLNTYYYDRFYSPGQELKIHTDRPACEISVTVHISTNASTPWPIWIKKPDTYVDNKKPEILKKGENTSVLLLPGDGMVYKGCERPHWREPMAREYRRTWYGKKIEKENLFYHQVFFHYVLANGLRAHFANDSSN